MNTVSKGKLGEDYICKYLQSKNIQILRRNYRAKKGEIDIIAKEEDTIVFIEVKLRTNDTYGMGAEAVTFKKQELLKQTAQYFIDEEGYTNFNFRFDVADIMLTDGNYKLNYISNAF